jgi:hypothetical protein
VEQATFAAPTHPASKIYGRIVTCGEKDGRPCAYRDEAETSTVDIVVWGGAANRVRTPATQVTVVVGEERPLGAVALAADERGGEVYSDDVLAYESSNPSVATVAADGVVRGVGAGTAMITATAGSAATTVNVTVETGTVGAIPDGLHTLLASAPEWALSPSVAAIPYAVALSDGAGPFVVANADHDAGADSRAGASEGGRVALARWTGSGFGFEVIGEPWDVALHPMVALDERDHVYVVYESENRRQYVVLDRAADARPGTETMRLLPSDLVEPTSFDARTRDYVAITTSRVELAAVQPRDGGGVWIAYEVYADYANGALGDHVQGDGVLPKRCQLAGLLAEVTDAGVDVRQVSSYFYEPGERGACTDGVPGSSGAARANMWLTLDPDGGVPATKFGRGQETRAAGMVTTSTLYRTNGGSAEIAGELDAVAGLESDGSVLTMSKRGTIQRTNPIHDANRNPGATGYEWMWSDSMWPELGIVPPYTTAPLVDDEPVGWGASRTHLATLHTGGLAGANDVTLAVARLPRPVKWTDDETAGRRFNGELNSPGIVDPPVVLADGSRYWLSRNINACSSGQPATTGLWTSAGPGERPQLVTASGASGLFYDQPLRAVGSTLYAVRREQIGNFIGFTVRRSTDGGATWASASSYAGQMLSSKLRAFATLPSGAGFAIMNGDGEADFRVIVTADVATGPWTALPGWTAAQTGVWSVHHTNADGFGLVPDGAGNMWVMVGARGNAAGGLLARKYSPAGAVLDEVLVNVPATGEGDLSVRAATATTLASGRLVVLGGETASTGPRYRLVSIVVDPATDAVATSVVVPDASVGRVVPLLRTGDGRVVLGAQRSDVIGSASTGYTTIRDRAVLYASTDGLDWSMPRVLRPDGGNGQVVYSLGLDTDGKLVTVVGDNGGYRATELLDAAFFEAGTPSLPATCDLTLVVPALMRVDAP